MIIDASGLVAGRLATHAAKKVLLGENVDIVNAEKAVITGNKPDILARHERFRAMGAPFHGPFSPRRADMILKKIIRGMLPYKKPRGAEAFKRIKCHIGVPDSLKGKDAVSLDSIKVKEGAKHLTLKQLSKLLGAK